MEEKGPQVADLEDLASTLLRTRILQNSESPQADWRISGQGYSSGYRIFSLGETDALDELETALGLAVLKSEN